VSLVVDASTLVAALVESGRDGFGNDVPPVLEHLGLAEVEHNARNNRMRAISG